MIGSKLQMQQTWAPFERRLLQELLLFIDLHYLSWNVNIFIFLQGLVSSFSKPKVQTWLKSTTSSDVLSIWQCICSSGESQFVFVEWNNASLPSTGQPVLNRLTGKVSNWGVKCLPKIPHINHNFWKIFLVWTKLCTMTLLFCCSSRFSAMFYHSIWKQLIFWSGKLFTESSVDLRADYGPSMGETNNPNYS